ncbi:MAG: hypothetical protein J6D54_00050 [Olsenella sp.]|nr:hypothetical protein [Olsenella sp.]
MGDVSTPTSIAAALEDWRRRSSELHWLALHAASRRRRRADDPTQEAALALVAGGVPRDPVGDAVTRLAPAREMVERMASDPAVDRRVVRVMELYYLGGMAVDEICREVGCSRASVWRWRRIGEDWAAAHLSVVPGGVD